MVAQTSSDILRELARTSGGPVYFEDPQTHARYVALRQDTFESLLPMPDEEQTQPSAEEWTEAKNARRFDLIHKKFDDGLAAEDASELALLQAEMLQYRDRVAPLPLEDARKLLGELLLKAAAAQQG
ncbi:MAG TPA: hypothetical protein VGI40_12470 [Pirellulaceae bacterium]|jgi:hypothetical protein